MHKFKRCPGKNLCCVYNTKSVVFSKLLLTLPPSGPKLKFKLLKVYSLCVAICCSLK